MHANDIKLNNQLANSLPSAKIQAKIEQDVNAQIIIGEGCEAG